jgi:predicted Zn-dependent peptidase
MVWQYARISVCAWNLEIEVEVKTTRLDNGLTVATDHIDNFETASVGIFVNVGSVNETPEQSGISHFLEHMAFKGTSRRSALEISNAIESVGGHMNAYTSNEVTAFYAKVLKGDVGLAIDIITDIIQDSKFDKEEFEKEQSVIVQEIHRTNDTPDVLVFDLFQGKCFDGESLGMSILGPEENILAFKPQDLANYLKSKYSTDKMILCASGQVDHDEVVELASKFANKMTSFDVVEPAQQKYKGGFIFKKKELEQMHIVLGFEGLDHTDQNKYELSVLSTILGGGMSSRLFQEVREKRGLVYTIFTDCSNNKDTGTFCVYAGCADQKAGEVIDVVSNEFEEIKKNLTDEEVSRAKTQIKANVLMGLEISSSRMQMMANQFITEGRFYTPSEITSFIDSVTRESVISVANRVFSTKPTLAVIGNRDDMDKLYKW